MKKLISVILAPFKLIWHVLTIPIKYLSKVRKKAARVDYERFVADVKRAMSLGLAIKARFEYDESNFIEISKKEKK